MQRFATGTSVLALALFGTLCLPGLAKADAPNALDLDGAAIPLQTQVSLAGGGAASEMADPVAIPLPTAAELGFMGLGTIAVWRGARRLRSIA